MGKLLVWTPKAALVSTLFSCAVESPAFLLSICSVLTETIVGGTSFTTEARTQAVAQFREALSRNLC